MAIAFDAATSSLTLTSSAYNISHTPVGTPRGVLVLIAEDGGTDAVTGITYGGTSLTEMTNSPFVGTNSEAGVIHAYFLGSSVPTGAQTCTITPSANTRRVTTCITVTAANDTEENIVSQLLDSNGIASPSATLSLSSVSSFVAQAFQSGKPSVGDISPLAGWTSRQEGDFGPSTAAVYTYDTIGTADVTCGYTAGGDNVQLLGAAINEVAGGGATTPKTVTATHTGTASMTKVVTFARTHTATHTAVASVSKASVFSRTLTATHTASSSVSMLSEFFRAFTATHTASASVSTLSEFFRTFTATATHTSSMAKGIVVSVLSSATHTGTANVSSLAVLGLTFSATANHTANVVKKIFKSFSTSHISTADVTKTTSKTLGAVHTGAASEAHASVLSVTSNATHTGTASSSQSFIAGTPTFSFIKGVVITGIAMIGKLIRGKRV